MTKEKGALEIIDRLRKEYPDAECSLEYDPKEAWRLLVSVRLAAQCTDARVNVVVKELYAKFPDVVALAQAEPEEIEAIVRPCGLGKSKARDISACMKILRGNSFFVFDVDIALLMVAGNFALPHHLGQQVVQHLFIFFIVKIQKVCQILKAHRPVSGAFDYGLHHLF